MDKSNNVLDRLILEDDWLNKWGVFGSVEIIHLIQSGRKTDVLVIDAGTEGAYLQPDGSLVMEMQVPGVDGQLIPVNMTVPMDGFTLVD